MTSGTSPRVTRPNGSPSTTASAGMTQTQPNWRWSRHQCPPASTQHVLPKVSLFTPNLLPGWIIGWFLFTAIICTWDASFIMLRPLSFPGQSLSSVWYPYKYYITLDKRYGNMNDSYVYTQSLLNLVEVILNIYTFYLNKVNSRHTVPLAFTVTVMTFWKTVLYFLMFAEPCGDTLYREGNSALAEFFLVIIPNGVWIVLPLLVLVCLWNRITPNEKIAD